MSTLTDLEGISKVRQRKTNNVCFHLYMESKNNNQGLRDWWLPEMGMGGCGLREMSEGVQKV